jgi:hypothetical protein
VVDLRIASTIGCALPLRCFAMFGSCPRGGG